MKTIQMISGRRYMRHGKLYRRGESYKVSGSEADYLLSAMNGRAGPFFRLVDIEPEDEGQEEPNPKPKARRRRKKAGPPATETSEEAVDV